MLSTVAVDDAIRTLSVELTKEKGASVIGEYVALCLCKGRAIIPLLSLVCGRCENRTEAERKVLMHYATKGRRRAAMGAIAGSSVMAGLWKMSKNKQRLVGAFAMMCE